MNGNSKHALAAVIVTYVLWGFQSIFWGALSGLDRVYTMAHRAFWSALFLFIYILLSGKGNECKAVLKNRRLLLTCAVSCIFLISNWALYIYAINSGQPISSSLGYYLVSVIACIIGFIVFREKPRPADILSVVVSVLGIGWLFLALGFFPVLSLLIALTFAIYGAIKKTVSVSPQVSLFVEMLLVTLPSIMFIIWSEVNGRGCAGVLTGPRLLLLPASGLVTVIPMLLFNLGITKLPYYITGILMYINPTLQFFTGLFWFHEALDKNRLILSVIIWIGVLFVIMDRIILLLQSKRHVKEQIS